MLEAKRGRHDRRGRGKGRGRGRGRGGPHESSQISDPSNPKLLQCLWCNTNTHNTADCFSMERAKNARQTLTKSDKWSCFWLKRNTMFLKLMVVLSFLYMIYRINPSIEILLIVIGAKSTRIKLQTVDKWNVHKKKKVLPMTSLQIVK